MDWESRLEQRAMREGWPVPPGMRVAALKRLAALLDPEHVHDGPDPTHAEVLACVRTLVLIDKQNLELRKYEDQNREADVSVADAVRAMAEEGEACDRERDGDNRGGDPAL